MVPRSYHCDVQHNLLEAQKSLGDEYREQPLFAPAGSCIFYDIAVFHTRLDGIGIADEATHGRRTIHEYQPRQSLPLEHLSSLVLRALMNGRRHLGALQIL